MKRTIMKCSIMFSLLLLTSCDISDEEIEQKAQSYTKSEHGISVKLNRIEIPGQGKDFIGPDTRTAYVQQVDEPYVQFQIWFDGRTSPKVKNDNYKIKKKRMIYEKDSIHTMKKKEIILYLLSSKCKQGILFSVRMKRKNSEETSEALCYGGFQK